MKAEKNEIEKLLAKAQQREETNGESKVEEIVSAIKGLSAIIKQKRKVTMEKDIEQIKKVKDTVIRILQKRKNPKVLREALQVLMNECEIFLEISNEKEVDEIKIALAKIIKQGDPSIRKLAVRTNIVYIKRNLLSDKKEEKQQALTKLKWLLETEPDQIGEEQSSVIVLMEDESWAIREEAVRILGIVGKGTKKDVDLLIKGLNDEKPEVLCRVVEILAELGRKGNPYVEKAVKPLERELKKLKSKDTRFQCAYALAQIQQTKKGTGYKELEEMDEEGLLTGPWLTKFEKLFYKTPKEKLKQKFDELLETKGTTKKGNALEVFCELFFNQIKGFEVTRDFRKGDQQIDLVIKNKLRNGFWSMLNSSKIFVECKYQEGKISTNEINWFATKIREQPFVKIGFFIALNGFSRECRGRLKIERINEATIGTIERRDFEVFFNENITYLKFLENIVNRTMNY